MKSREAYLHRLQIETTKFLLDAYLLTGQVSLQDVKHSLVVHEATAYSQHLKLCSLSEGLPDDEEERVRRLLRLRLLFADHLTDESRSENRHLIETFLCVRSFHHSLRAYVDNMISRHELETQIIRAHSKHAVAADCWLMMNDLIATVAEDPEEVSRPNVVSSCLKTQRRLEAFWNALLG